VVTGGLDLHASPQFWGLAAATGLVATVIPNFILNAGMGRIGAQSTAMISTLSPVITIFMAISILGEPFTILDALGTLLVIGGIGLHTWFDMKSHRQKP
jgi:drug/metabolite transporter (DMT)-like permease